MGIEESQKDLNRARSIFERALSVDFRNHSLWIKYAEFEMRNKLINHARNVWDRAVSILPGIDQLWYKYIHMEEMLGNVASARWKYYTPSEQGLFCYVEFELRYNEIENARQLFDRLVECHPKANVWIRYAKFEMKNGEIGRARKVYERAVEKLDDIDDDEEEVKRLLVAFAEFEEQCKEVERANCIYKFALKRIPKVKAMDFVQ